MSYTPLQQRAAARGVSASGWNSNPVSYNQDGSWEVPVDPATQPSQVPQQQFQAPQYTAYQFAPPQQPILEGGFQAYKPPATGFQSQPPAQPLTGTTVQTQSQPGQNFSWPIAGSMDMQMYAPQQGVDMSAWSPTNMQAWSGRYADGTSPEFMAAYPDVLPPPGMRPGWEIDTTGSQPAPGSFGANWYSNPPNPYANFFDAYGNQAPAPRSPRFTNIDGSVTQSPNFGLRDAFIQAVTDFETPYFLDPSQGRPQHDIQALLAKAKEMQAGGWSNPLTGLLGQ